MACQGNLVIFVFFGEYFKLHLSAIYTMTCGIKRKNYLKPLPKIAQEWNKRWYTSENKE